MTEIELSNAARNEALRQIKKISPSTYRDVMDDGIHGRMDDAKLEMTRIKLVHWAKKVERD